MGIGIIESSIENILVDTFSGFSKLVPGFSIENEFTADPFIEVDSQDSNKFYFLNYSHSKV